MGAVGLDWSAPIDLCGDLRRARANQVCVLRVPDVGDGGVGVARCPPLGEVDLVNVPDYDVVAPDVTRIVGVLLGLDAADDCEPVDFAVALEYVDVADGLEVDIPIFSCRLPCSRGASLPDVEPIDDEIVPDELSLLRSWLRVDCSDDRDVDFACQTDYVVKIVDAADEVWRSRVAELDPVIILDNNIAGPGVATMSPGLFANVGPIAFPSLPDTCYINILRSLLADTYHANDIGGAQVSSVVKLTGTQQEPLPGLESFDEVVFKDERPSSKWTRHLLDEFTLTIIPDDIDVATLVGIRLRDQRRIIRRTFARQMVKPHQLSQSLAGLISCAVHADPRLFNAGRH